MSNTRLPPQYPHQPYQTIGNQFNNSGSGPQNNSTGSGDQHNYNAPGQNINHGEGDQNINSGQGYFYARPGPVQDQGRHHIQTHPYK
ncbi:hypothetical protein E1B28_003401 [Marasmius oreades]|uniref:Uncharacterized protein n=1 Tax=Marasmius oreades TaxID=181124 RepID=A0A9P7RMH2_9AGAR|nr:uncharacterized protein E1B28_003401 [Marasmius oreades]KAG7085868.1 hypothetical protein E1B28_003401 [Marasmius oreades]